MMYACEGRGCDGIVGERAKLCDACWSYRHVIHTGIRRLWISGQSMTTPGRADVDHVSGGAGPGSSTPVRDSVFEVLDVAVRTVVEWATFVRADRGMAPLPPFALTRKGWIFDLAMVTLVDLDSVLTGRPVAVEYYNDLYGRHRQLVKLIDGTVRETEHVDGNCRFCGSATLCSREHRDYYLCLTCGARWGQSSWHQQINESVGVSVR